VAGDPAPPGGDLELRREPRVRVIAVGVVAGLLAGTAMAVGAWGYMHAYGFYADYKSDFDRNVQLHSPRLAGVLQANRALRLEIENKQRLAFHYGAPTASGMFWTIVASRLLAAAGDPAIRACQAAYTDVFRASAAHPHLCRQLVRAEIPLKDTGLSVSDVARADMACDLAYQDGAQRQSAPPPYLYGDAWYAAVARAQSGPVAFSTEDRAAMADPAMADPAAASDAAICAEGLKFNENVDAMISPDGASLMRSTYAAAGEYAVIDMRPPEASPPSDDALHCAAQGTRFVLNNFLQDGRPNEWTSLGRHGFDCAVVSPGSGAHGVFRTINEDLSVAHVPNLFRAVWPLVVGKSVSLTYIPVRGDPKEEQFSVASFSRFWLPWGSVDAFALDREIWQGHYHYVVIEYWAPSLGFTIGRRTYAISGGIPDYEGQDYQVVAIIPPG
jgi:hypothetical protein